MGKERLFVADGSHNKVYLAYPIIFITQTEVGLVHTILVHLLALIHGDGKVGRQGL